MKSCIHPTHKKSVLKKFFAIWVTSAIFFGLGLFFNRSDFKIPMVVFFGLVAVSIFGGLFYLLYLHYNVTCLTCDGKTKTISNKSESKWIAVCERCQIEWDLQISNDSD